MPPVHPPYPPADRSDHVDRLHGREVPDPYRWLEDPNRPDTAAWTAAQEALCRPWLDARPGRDELGRRRRELMPGDIGLPAVRGGRTFLMRRRPDQEHAVLVVLEDGEPPDAGRVLIDPAALSADGTVTLDAWQPSKEGELVAYQLSQGGDEESSLLVLDGADGRIVEGPIDRCRYSPVAWLPGGGAYYYVRRLPPHEVPEGEAQYHRRVYLHQVGADPADDEEVFGAGRDKTAFYGLSVALDGRWLTISESIGTAPRNDVWLADLHTPGGHSELRVVHEGIDAETRAHVGNDGRLHCHTTLGAPRWRLAVADPEQPTPDHWTDLLPETDAVLQDWCLTDDAVVAVRSRHAVSEVTVHDRSTGAARRRLDLPGLGVAEVTSRPDGGDEVWVAYSDFITPAAITRHRVGSGEAELWAAAPGAVTVDGVVSEQVTYRSADGTEVRMFVIHRAGVIPDGAAPTILYGYGGFGIPMEPQYSAGIVAWVEQGGVYAVANLRGGSEEGEEWHRDGMRGRKQHVFDDFVAAGERLVADGWTAPTHLGISGGSNGGLLVGAALTQRPDLFSAVVCSAPLLDMVRYEEAGLGRLWTDEYGSAAVAEELDWLLSYSPYHHVVEGTAYPSVLFTVFESDTRVDPLHARKMCAALQSATSRPFSEAPILYRNERDVGHGARSTTRSIELSVDTLTYLRQLLT